MLDNFRAGVAGSYDRLHMCAENKTLPLEEQ